MPPKGKRKIMPLGWDMIVLTGVCIAIVMGSFLAYRPILFQNLFREEFVPSWEVYRANVTSSRAVVPILPAPIIDCHCKMCTPKSRNQTKELNKRWVRLI